MEGLPLRAVPLRPAGPVDPDAALAHVEAALPDLDGEAARLLALVEMAGAPREAAARDLGIEQSAAAVALARGRKALRRSLVALTGSGWCERAERLISDRIDGPLGERASARLDAHLANCDRCVTHERRLGQARDDLVRTFFEEHPGSGPTSAAAEQDSAPLHAAPLDAPRAELDGGQTLAGVSQRLGWYVLFAIAVLIALAALAVAALVIAGVDL
jgi:Putative zinc-finger